MGGRAYLEDSASSRRFVNDAPANAAAGAAAVLGATSIGTWLANINTAVSILAGLVAIVAGLYAIAHYRRAAKTP